MYAEDATLDNPVVGVFCPHCGQAHDYVPHSGELSMISPAKAFFVWAICILLFFAFLALVILKLLSENPGK
jgi:hypothetical protein